MSTNETNQQVIVQNIIQQPEATVITTERTFSVLWFIFWLLFFWPGAIIQVVCFFCKPKVTRTTVYR